MATRQTQTLARLMMQACSSVVLLLLWMIVPLAMTVWFSFLDYNLLDLAQWAGPGCSTTASSSATPPSRRRSSTLAIVLGVLFITIVGGILLALLIDQPMFGQGSCGSR